MIKFESHPDCQNCKLYNHAVNPGLPSRPFIAEKKPIAVVFVGEAPGVNEDKNKRIWCGWSGNLLEKFVFSTDLQKKADIYFANACRCRPAQDSTPTKGQVKKCHPFLLEDLRLLSLTYPTLILFCLGAVASSSIYRKNLTESFATGQGEVLADLPGSPRVFFSFHPALLYPTRRPQLLHAVKDHWNLLLQYLEQGELPRDHLIVEPIINLQPPDS